MNIKYYNRPVLFYFLSIAIPWVMWFSAAYISHKTTTHHFLSSVGGVLSVAGLFSPMVIAYCLMRFNPKLKDDIWGRLFSFPKAKLRYLVLTCLIMPVSILLAQAISLLFGHSVDQFQLAGTTSFTYVLFPAWFMLFLAPVVEELAWHSYGTDCLRARFSLFTTCILFSVFWIFWHFPLSFIKDYYHANVAAEGLIYALNFAFSLFPFVFLMNWLYYKTDRNILVAIIFHITAGVFNELFQTHPDSKVIQTGLLIILAIFIILREREFFFGKLKR